MINSFTQSPRATRRRARKRDPLAAPDAVAQVLEALREHLPDLMPKQPAEVQRLLTAVRHRASYAGTGSKRGRRGRYAGADLQRVHEALQTILHRETQGRIQLRSFVDHYLRIPGFPADVVKPLVAGEINLFEAEQLARLNETSLRTTKPAAARQRAELLRVHLSVQESGNRLRLRVNQLLGQGDAPEPGAKKAEHLTAFPSEPPLSEFEDDLDPTHLFYDQLRQINLALRDLHPADLSSEQMDGILDLSDQLLTLLARARKRKNSRALMPV